MKRFELYLYLFLTAAVWIAIVLAPMWARSPNIAAKAIALPFLAWIVLTAYYLLRWCVWRVRSASKKSRRAKA